MDWVLQKDGKNGKNDLEEVECTIPLWKACGELWVGHATKHKK